MIGTALVLIGTIGALLLAAALHRGLLSGFGDEYFSDVIPGQLPPPRTPGVRRTGREAHRMVERAAVQFHPPEGVRPGSVGVIEGRSVTPRDLGAAFVDLAIRGYFRIGRPGPPPSRHQRADWLLEAPHQPPPPERLSRAERTVLAAMFPQHSQVLLSAAKPAMRTALVGLREELDQEAVGRRWLQPSRAGSGWRIGGPIVGVGALILVVGSLLGAPDRLFLPGLFVVVLAGAHAGLGRPRPRTAEGTAVAVQVAGFRRYIATAEARQLRFEEAAGIFSRYLPWAIAFDLTDHWCRVFKDVVAQARAQGDVTFAGGYVGSGDPGVASAWGTDLAWLSDISSSLDSMVSGVEGTIGDLSSGVADVVADVTSSIDSMVGDVTSSVSEASGGSIDGSSFAGDSSSSDSGSSSGGGDSGGGGGDSGGGGGGGGD